MLAVLTVPATSSGADLDVRYQSISALGEMNGVALQCKYLDQVRRMKRAVVDSAPKERSFGLAFDQATNRSFLEFVAQGKPCPGPAGFELQVGERIEAVRRSFSTDAENDDSAGSQSR
jgi:hypothetical protein